MPAPINGYAGAAAAYEHAARAATADTSPAPKPDSGATGGGFADMVKDAMAGAVGSLEHGEQVSMAAIAGTADLSEVVTAVADAEMTLKTVVAVRDKVIDAYKDIMRMPV